MNLGELLQSFAEALPATALPNKQSLSLPEREMEGNYNFTRLLTRGNIGRGRCAC